MLSFSIPAIHRDCRLGNPDIRSRIERKDVFEAIPFPLGDIGSLVLHGRSGCGKSTIAAALMDQCGGAWVAPHDLCEDLSPQGLAVAMMTLCGAMCTVLDPFWPTRPPHVMVDLVRYVVGYRSDRGLTTVITLNDDTTIDHIEASYGSRFRAYVEKATWINCEDQQPASGDRKRSNINDLAVSAIIRGYHGY